MTDSQQKNTICLIDFCYNLWLEIIVKVGVDGMARARSFDRQEKLIAAMELFWQKGYSDTSVADLVEHLGINRFSLYNTYTDKSSLYQEALDYYLSNISLPKLDVLRTAEAGLQDIIHYIEQFATLQRKQKQGCFLQNAVAERINQDDNIADRSTFFYEAFASAFEGALQNDQKKGNIDPAVNIKALSHYIVIQLQGVRLLGKARQYTMIDDAIAIIVETLERFRL